MFSLQADVLPTRNQFQDVRSIVSTWIFENVVVWVDGVSYFADGVICIELVLTVFAIIDEFS